jgi:uncharacterized protein
MKYFSVLIKPSSSKCNINCKYCFYKDVSINRDIKDYGFMNDDTVDSIINKTLDYFKDDVTITYAFQGGEPTLVGLNYFKKFVDKVKIKKESNHHINYSIQTNGILIDDDWLKFFKINDFLVGISFDGIKKVHDQLRVYENGEPTFDIVMNSYKKMVDLDIKANMLTVLTHQLSKYPKELYKFYQDNNIDFVQLIPCLPKFGTEHDEYSLTPIDFSTFYNIFFDLWYKELQAGTYRSVTLFDNIIPMFANIPPQQCGYLGFCSMQNVFEADGSVYPCDFYVLDQYNCGNININSIDEILNNTNVSEFLNEKRRLSALCPTCEFKNICNGQCKRMNVTYFTDDYCGYKDFIKTNYNKMIEIAKSLNK